MSAVAAADMRLHAATVPAGLAGLDTLDEPALAALPRDRHHCGYEQHE